MLKALVESSLRHRYVVIALAVPAAGYCLLVTANAKMDVLPEFALSQVIIHTEAPGLSPEEVEALVTRPVENGVSGTGGMKYIRSQSTQGISIVTAVFLEGTDIPGARQRVSERLLRIAEELPPGVRAPLLAPATSSTSFVLGVGLTSEKRSAMDVRTIADGLVRPRLAGVPGVASVLEFGGEVRQIQVQIRPDALAAHELSVTQLIEAAREATGLLGAGFIETENQRISIRTEGQSLTAEELGECLALPGVRLKDVARIVEAPGPKIGDAAINGRPGVLLLVWSQFGQNTLEVTASLEAALEEIQPSLEAEGILLHRDLFRPATFIEASLRNVTLSLILGGALAAAALFLFYFHAWTALISILAIALSLLAAITALCATGATLNTLTFGGLAMAIGAVIDDAIIDVENIFQRLRDNPREGSPRSVFQVVLEASLEVKSAGVLAAFVMALIFLPVIGMSGVQGKLLLPLAIAFILAILASLLVGLIVTPALSLVLFARATAREEPPHIRKLNYGHYRLLGVFTRSPGWVIAGAFVLCAAAAFAVPFLGGELIPELQEGHLIVQMSAAPGTSSIESMRLGCEVSREILAHPHVRSVSLQVGRAELGEEAAGTESSELIVALKPLESEDEAEAVRREIHRLLAAVPGAKFAVKPFRKRFEETLSGARADVTVRIYGNDLNFLDEKALEVEKVLAGIHGSSEVGFQRSEEPRIMVRLRRDKLSYLGFRPVEVLDAVRTGFQGLVAAKAYDKNRVFDIVVILDEAARREPEGVGSVLVRNASGVQIPIRELADVFLTTGRSAVLHEGLRRYQEVSCNVEARDLESFVTEARAQVATQVNFPPSVYAVFGGVAEGEAQARHEILLSSLLAATGILFCLAMAARRIGNLILILATLPFALAGGLLAVFGAAGSLSLGSVVGFVAIFGITVRHSILLMSRFEHLVAVQAMPWGAETALRGASERFLPVLMTATVTALALLPLAVGARGAGREIVGPMAVVIAGGMVTSAALNLLVLPALALRYGRFGKPERNSVPSWRDA